MSPRHEGNGQSWSTHMNHWVSDWYSPSEVEFYQPSSSSLCCTNNNWKETWLTGNTGTGVQSLTEPRSRSDRDQVQKATAYLVCNFIDIVNLNSFHFVNVSIWDDIQRCTLENNNYSALSLKKLTNKINISDFALIYGTGFGKELDDWHIWGRNWRIPKYFHFLR